MQLVYLVFGTNIQNHLMQVIDRAALRYWEGEHPRRLWPPQDVEYRG